MRKNLQGINGYSLDARDHERLPTLIKAKGGDLTALPRLYSHSVSLNKELTKEEHVESQLIEPLLEQLGYRLSDWER